MHWIQYDILLKLTRTESARYSELRPAEVEGNLFIYHLKKLITRGLIEKHDHDYMLTDQGREDAASLRLTVRKQTVPPQVNVAVLYTVADHMVLYRWNRAPYRNQISIPFGRVEAGGSLFEIAAAQLHYKTSLEPKRLEMAGLVELRLFRGEKLLRHQLIHIVRASGGFGEVAADGLTGQPFWGDLNEINEEWVAGYREIISLAMGNNKMFYKELIINQ